MSWASLLGSTSVLHYHVVNVRTVAYLQSAVLLCRGTERCAHTAKTRNPWEVGTRSVKQGWRYYVCKRKHIALMRMWLLCLDYCSTARERNKLPSAKIKTYLLLLLSLSVSRSSFIKSAHLWLSFFLAKKNLKTNCDFSDVRFESVGCPNWTFSGEKKGQNQKPKGPFASLNMLYWTKKAGGHGVTPDHLMVATYSISVNRAFCPCSGRC